MGVALASRALPPMCWKRTGTDFLDENMLALYCSFPEGAVDSTIASYPITVRGKVQGEQKAPYSLCVERIAGGGGAFDQTFSLSQNVQLSTIDRKTRVGPHGLHGLN